MMKVSITAVFAVVLLCSVTAKAQQSASDGAPASLLDNSSLPLTFNATTLEGDEQVCPPQEQLEIARAEIYEDV